MHPHRHFGDRTDGDLAGAAPAGAPGGGVPDPPWTWLTQVHGTGVVTVTRPGEHAGVEADAAVTAVPGCALMVRTADCAPVWFGAAGAVGIAHAGWRGLLDGVLTETVAAMVALGADRVVAEVGPCIGPECYEFGEPELTAIADRFGPSVRGRTAEGRAALDLRAGVRAALAELDVPLAGAGPVPCTACAADRFHSYRARAEAGRQGSFAWLSA